MFLFLILILPSKFELDERLLGDLGSAADVERAHGELGARLADRLRGDDADRLAHVDRRAAGKIAPVAHAAHAVGRSRRSAPSGCAAPARRPVTIASTSGSSSSVPFLTMTLCDDGSRTSSAVVRPRMRVASEATTVPASMIARTLMPAAGAAVLRRDDAVLRHVDQTPRQVAGVRGLQRGVGEALAGAVGRVEVLEHRQPFLEVRDDRALDDLARRLRHQAAHAGKLAASARASRARRNAPSCRSS